MHYIAGPPTDHVHRSTPIATAVAVITPIPDTLL
jgi:hypothetical protein